jgi:hypothetical protein
MFHHSLNVVQLFMSDLHFVNMRLGLRGWARIICCTLELRLCNK